MASKSKPGDGASEEKKPFGRNPLKPWVYWTVLIVSIVIVVAVIVITVSTGTFVTR